MKANNFLAANDCLCIQAHDLQLILLKSSFVELTIFQLIKLLYARNTLKNSALAV